MSSPRIAFIGAGNMASSLIGGLLAQGVPASQLCASDSGAEQRAKVAQEFGIEVFVDNAQACLGADLIVLAVKPQGMKDVCSALAAHLQPAQLVVSIAAGISCASLAQWLGLRPIVRCMPNTPALLRQGVSGLFANAEVSSTQRAQALQLCQAVGLALWLEQEAQLDAVTALSGSGPAYFFLMIEAMSAAGQTLGLSTEVAAQLAQHTALGAARMACENTLDAAELRRRVTSPGGTTAAAIAAFQKGGFEALVAQAMQAAADRSAQMSIELGQ